MTKGKRIGRIAALALLLAPGMTLLGTSCSLELRDAAIGAGADFLADSLATVFETLIPVEDWLAQAQGING